MQLIKIIVLQLYWYVSIKYGANPSIPLLGLVIFTSDYLIFKRRENLNQRYIYFSFCLVLCGGLMDKLFSQLGILTWGKDLYPPELLGVWVIFPTYYFRIFKKFENPKWLPFLMGALFGPLAYISGGRLNPSLVLSMDLEHLIVISFFWGLLFKVSLSLFPKFRA